MRGLLLWLFPAWWRRRHGAAFRALLDSIPLTARTVAEVLGAAARAWCDPRASRLTVASAAALMVASLVLLAGFLDGWGTIYRQTSGEFGLWLVRGVALGYAGLGLFVSSRGHRVVGMLTVVVALLGLVWQGSIGAPDWRSTQLPMQVCVLWSMALSCWCAWWVAYGVHDPRRPSP
jgi:hypothetical protein